jgi:hypothetical protein
MLDRRGTQTEIRCVISEGTVLVVSVGMIIRVCSKYSARSYYEEHPCRYPERDKLEVYRPSAGPLNQSRI